MNPEWLKSQVEDRRRCPDARPGFADGLLSGDREVGPDLSLKWPSGIRPRRRPPAPPSGTSNSMTAPVGVPGHPGRTLRMFQNGSASDTLFDQKM